MLEKSRAHPEGLNPPETGLADTGDYSAKKVEVCPAAKIEPLIAVKREEHPPDGRDRFTEPMPLADDASPVETLKHKLKTYQPDFHQKGVNFSRIVRFGRWSDLSPTG